MPEGRAAVTGAAIVTGAGNGIGAACAEALARAGAEVTVADIDEAAAERTAERIRRDGGAATAVRLDISDEQGWQKVVADVEARHGHVSTLVNNAGIKAALVPDDRGLLELSMATFDRMLGVNLRGTVLGARAVLPGMIDAGRGSIINMSSVAADRSVRGVGVTYSVSKGALNALTRSLAVTYGPLGVRCNAVAPGVVMVESQVKARPDQAEPLTALGLVAGTAEQIADAVQFLASTASSYVNGHILAVDGGLSATMPGLTRDPAELENRD